MEFLKYFYTKQLLYLYGTTLSMKQKSGLEFEREYSAMVEGYRYV